MNGKYFIWLLVLLITLSGCIGANSAQIGNKVAVDYIGSTEDGKIFDTSVQDVAQEAGIHDERREYVPLEFTIGNNEMIKGFENAIIGMKVGETKKITLDPKDAYGERRESLIQNVSKSVFGNSTIPPVGTKVYSAQGGSATIVAIYDENVTIDMNHELAGKVLNFEITLVKIY